VGVVHVLQSPTMDRVGVRELRNYTSRVVARARAGERIVITVDGIPAAEIGPIVGPPHERSMEELVAAGLVIPPRVRSETPPKAHPVKLSGRRRASDIVIEERDRGL
jgi:prevent-host-death family protein